MNISGSEYKSYQVVELVGKIDRLKDSIVLKSHVNALLDKNHLNIALDLSKVTYLDSGALNVLIYAHNSLKKKNGLLVLIQPNEYVRDVLEVVGLDKLVKIHATEEEFHNDAAHSPK
jgi:anti-sigma B factor antagonist